MSEHKQIIFQKMKVALSSGMRDGYLDEDLKMDPHDEPRLQESLVRQLEESDPQKLWEYFEARVTALGDTALLFSDDNRLKEWFVKQLEQRNFKLGVCDPDALEFLGIEAGGSLGGARIETAADRETLFQAQFGITLADYAVAETGTVGMVHTGGRSRLASLAPEVHYIVLRRSQLLPDLLDALHKHKEYSQRDSILWITGSSRTADIDGVLIHGAHGPKELFILVVG